MICTLENQKFTVPAQFDDIHASVYGNGGSVRIPDISAVILRKSPGILRVDHQKMVRIAYRETIPVAKPGIIVEGYQIRTVFCNIERQNADQILHFLLADMKA